MVDGIGLDLWDLCKKRNTAVEWKTVTDPAITKVLRKWGRLGKEVQPKEKWVPEPKEPRPKAPRLQSLQKWKPEDEVWQRNQGAILILGDNLAMVDIVNGRQTYQGDNPLVVQLLEQATLSIVNILAAGWSPKDIEHDVVQWRDRKWNLAADEVAKQAMDRRESLEWWSKTLPDRDINIMMFVDGGRRGNGASSSAYVVFALQNGFMRLIDKGAYFGDDVDSFVAECRSMQLATTNHTRLLITTTQFTWLVVCVLEEKYKWKKGETF